jgi:hypothetical protein
VRHQRAGAGQVIEFQHGSILYSSIQADKHGIRRPAYRVIKQAPLNAVQKQNRPSESLSDGLANNSHRNRAFSANIMPEPENHTPSKKDKPARQGNAVRLFLSGYKDKK